MKTNGMIFIASILMSSVTCAPAATNDLSAALQRGLFEEEANHNLDAAIQAYQSVINQYDNDRKLAATAIFRLGESYRKQGKTNEAATQYERVLREFDDQSTLADLSRNNLGVRAGFSERMRQVLQGQGKPSLEAGGETPSSPSNSAEADEIKRIQAMIKDSPDLINSPDQKGETLLQKTAAKGESATVKLLLENGAAIDGTKQPDLTALHYAAGNGHKAVDPLEAARRSYESGTTDEFIEPITIVDKRNEPVGSIRSEDAVIFYNYRADRAREMTLALTDDKLEQPSRSTWSRRAGPER